MKKIFGILFLLIVGKISFFPDPVRAQSSEQRIIWRSFEQALTENSLRVQQGLSSKKIFIDVYTDWCGWCKRLDVTTFVHPEIVRYMDSNFIPVKLDAERTDTVLINGQAFVNRNVSAGRRGSHDLAISLLQGKMSYPSCTFLDEEGRQITIVPGYLGPDKFEILLHFIAEDAYKTKNWEAFEAEFAERAKIR